MAITFHCKYCGKKIEAPDSAAGKWGKCSGCHNKICVPDLNADEELKLAPIDESEEERKRQLMAETYKLEQDVLREREAPNGLAGAAVSTSAVSDEQLTKNIILYLRRMADGELDEAQKAADLITPHGRRAAKILNRITLSKMSEPELADIPQRVLSGLIKTLRARIS